MEKEQQDNVYVQADDNAEAGLLVNRDFALLTPVAEDSAV